VNRNLRTALLYLFFIVLGLLFLANTLQPMGAVEELSSSEFVTALEDGRVVNATVLVRSLEVEGEFYPDEAAEKAEEPTAYTTSYLDNEALFGVLKDSDTEYTVDPQDTSIWLTLLTSFLPIVVIIIVMVWLMNQMQGGNSKVMSFGKSRAKRITRDQPRITFKDVAGVDEAVEELEEIKEFLANPGKFQALGAKIPKGVLLVGPPGTGKTLLARAVAGEAGVPFFTISGSDFVEMFVGVGASRVRDLFEQAKAASPCIVFIDELDAVGRMRGAGLGGGHDEREQTLNQLLVEMDGFDIKDNVIIMAATNRPDVTRRGVAAPRALRSPDPGGPP